MFAECCFIRKNTKELRDKLNTLGIRPNKFDDNEYKWLVCNYGLYISIREGFETFSDDIDCGDNEDLFIAIVALRDDSDINQWFVLDTNVSCASENFKPKGTFVLCKRDNWYIDINENKEPEIFSSRNIPAHKATIEELIEHFNK